MSHRQATSANVLTLPSAPGAKPSAPTAKLEVVGGRQHVVRFGIFFTVVGRHRRSVYEQLDGQIVLAYECKCRIDYPDAFFPDHVCSGVTFVVTPSLECPIDCHKVRGLRNTEAQ
jgi:hypothetical protein